MESPDALRKFFVPRGRGKDRNHCSFIRSNTSTSQLLDSIEYMLMRYVNYCDTSGIPVTEDPVGTNERRPHGSALQTSTCDEFLFLTSSLLAEAQVPNP